jgi:hypothetical protein
MVLVGVASLELDKEEDWEGAMGEGTLALTLNYCDEDDGDEGSSH